MTAPSSPIEIENDFQQKVMTQRFTSPLTLSDSASVQAWRSAWMVALGQWHSPYKALIDCTNLSISDSPEVRKSLDVMLKFFNGFFLRKAVGYGLDATKGHAALPFPMHLTEEEAAVDLGVRQPKNREPTDFRGAIQIQNHFQTHVVEVSLAIPVVIETKEQVATLKSKLMNNLMQWHSKWSLLLDCTNVEFKEDVRPDVEKMLTSLRGFFMKEAIGYSPKLGVAKESYPFPIYRARHKAAAILEGEGNFSGDKADCNSKKA